MKFAIVLLTIFFYSSLDPTVSWSYEEHPVLTWNDFRGTPLKNAIHAASVNSGMSYKFSYKNIDGESQLKIEVQSHFYPELSWKKDLNESSQELLAHEQLHWDITQLHVLKLRHAFSKYRPVKNPKSEIAFIFKKFEKERASMQSRYDKETRHGVKKEEQAKWKIFVAGELFKVPM